MKVDFIKVFEDTEGKPLKETGTDAPITLRATAINGLLADFDQNGQPIRGDAKMKRFEVYMKIKTAPDPTAVELTPEDVALIREAVGVFSTLIAGQARAALA